ncbi:molybdopterin-binding protein [Kitasatospora phosalacinea]|uniref:Molybdopterin-binding protein n=1 Tax=Kitasatospora phosalacinea TaxID=2065 RepID=A0A9W6QB36_9ACTN|nr:sulfite oxidase-like oxidoreductase [Kitasatospora phosalacinea]GLW73770.1 molybdopterin-binding protein [Kitasatospora phosalacinea]
MATLTPGFHGHRRTRGDRLPPGQFRTEDFPVLSAGPTPEVPLDRWEFTLTTEDGEQHRWTWEQFQALPQQDVTTDLHCVTRWSKFDTRWRGVSLDTLLEGVATGARFALAECHGGYTTNLPLDDLRGGKAWIAHTYDGEPLAAEHGGPARLLVPHLYFWKSAKWISGITLGRTDRRGFWEQFGYHDYGDPWREQRTWND